KGQGVAVNNYKARRASSDEKLANSTVGEQVSMGSEQLQRRASKNRGDGAKFQVSEQIPWSVSKSKVDGATPVVMEQILWSVSKSKVDGATPVVMEQFL